MKSVFYFAVLACCLAALPTASAQSDAASELFGKGVHAYHSGDYEAALEQLTASIESDAEDPRPYYFRGLIYLMQGKEEAAHDDFRKGADVEAADGTLPKLVNLALMRVQGTPRVTIEGFRVAGRTGRRDRVQEEISRRYEQLSRSEEELLLMPKRAVSRPEKVFDEEPGDVLSPAAKTPRTLRPAAPGTAAEEMPKPEAPDVVATPMPEKMPAKPEIGTPEAAPAVDAPPAGAAKPAAEPKPDSEPAVAGGQAPGRLGRLFGVFTKPAAKAIENTGNQAGEAFPGVPGQEPPLTDPNP